MRWLFTLILFHFVGGLVMFCSGQNYTYSIQQFAYEDGLLHRSVNTVFEDHRGIIWLGSPNGLQRFDGHHFKSYFNQDVTCKKFNISKIGEDDAGWLWLWNTNDNDFVFIHSVTEQILTRKQRFGDKFPLHGLIHETNSGWHYLGDRIPVDSNGALCFVTSKPNRLVKYSSKRGFEHSQLPDTKGFITLKNVNSDGSLWIFENMDKWSMHYVDTFQQIISTFKLPLLPNMGGVSSVNNKLYFTLSNDSFENQYCVNPAGIHFIGKKHVGVSTKTYYSKWVWQFKNDAWRVFNENQTQTLFSIQVKGLKKSIYPKLSSIYEDSRHRVWMYGEYGLTTILARKSRFKNYITMPHNGITANSVRGICEKDNFLFANLEFGGLISVNKQAPSKINLEHSERFAQSFTGRPLLFMENMLYSGFETKIVQYQYPFDHRTFTTINDSFSYQGTWAMFNYNGKLLIGKDFGIYAYDSQTNSYLKESYTLEDGRPADIGQVMFISKGSTSKTIYVGGNRGLFELNPVQKIVINHLGKNLFGGNALPASNYYCLHQDVNDVIWLGTNAGLIKLDQTGGFKVYNETNGFSNNTIYAILEDDFGCLWLSSDYGLMRFDKSTNMVKTYLTKDGISHNEFNRISYYKGNDGRLYFGGLNGITSLNPKDFLKDNEHKLSSIILTEIKVFNTSNGLVENRMSNLLNKGELNIQPNNGFVKIHFALPNYEDDYLNRYAWKIDQIHSDWQYQTHNDIQLNALPYGTYHLSIKGQNSGGLWTSEPYMIQLNVLKPFYLQKWFVALIFVLSIVFMIFYAQRKTWQYRNDAKELQVKIQEATAVIEHDKLLIKKQADDLRALDKTKSQFYANISHELRTPLTLVLGPLDTYLRKFRMHISSDQKKLIELSLSNTKKLEKRVNEILDLSKLDAKKLTLKAEPVIINDFLDINIQGFKNMATVKNIGIEFKSSIPPNSCIEVDTNKFIQILDNLMSNAVKHSPPYGIIEVSLQAQSSSTYRLSISDEGRGVAPTEINKIFDRFYQTEQGKSVGGTGIGLTLSRELAQLMGGDIQVSSLNQKGAKFIFTFQANFGDALLSTQIPKPQHTYAEERNTTRSEESHKPRILVVEDNNEMRGYMVTILNDDYVVFEARDGLEAIGILNSTVIDIITSDVMMPNMDGFDFLRKLKSESRFKTIPVIMVTAKAEQSDLLSALHIGVDDYIVKPFYDLELITRVKNILNNISVRSKHHDSLKVEDQKEEGLWLQSVRDIILDHLADTRFDVSQLTESVNMVERTLNRKLNAIVGMSSGQFIREIRLLKAQEFLLNKDYLSVKEVSIAVGFRRPDYFAKAFIKRFGKEPRSYFS